MKKVLLVFLCICFYANVNAQVDTPGNITPRGRLDKLYDKEGRSYNLVDIQISSSGVNKAASTATCGYFKLFFEASSGMENSSDATHMSRRNVMCQVFNDISNFIPAPAGTPLANGTTFVNVWVRNINNVFSNPGPVLGAASSFYSVPYGTTSGIGGIVDNEIWKTINSGTDSYTNVTSPLNGGSFYHGLVTFNFNFPWNTILTSSTSPAANEIDLYTVALHEVTHALGFASLIDYTGNSRLGATLPYYARYDKFLKTQLGVNLISNSGSCSLYNFNWNAGVGSPNSTLSPNQTGCSVPNTTPSDNTPCTTAIMYSSANITTGQKVYTPGCYEPGSSLSHFEDQCAPTNFGNNTYFVMSNATGAGMRKRYLKAEERKTLCDLGYKTSTTYGNNSVVYDSYFNYGGTVCNGNQVVGINDGLNGGLYNYVVASGAFAINIPLTGVNGVLANDQFTTTSTAQWGIECVQDIYFSSSSSVTVSGGNIIYTPPTVASGFSGATLLRYIPYNTSTGIRGNITYIYVYVKNSNCTPSTCDLVNNGGVESATCGVFSPGSPGSVSCWEPLLGTPDIVTRNCNNSTYTTAGVSFPNTYNGAPNNNYFFCWASNSSTTYGEGVQIELSSPIIPNQSYVLSFWGKVKDGTTNHNIVQFTGLPNTIPPISTLPIPVITNVVTGSADIGSTINIPKDNTWHYFSIPFIFSGPVNCNALGIYNHGFNSPYQNWYSGILIDDISILPVNSAINFTPPSVLCIGSNLSDLSLYASSAGGVFSGSGVALNGGIYSFNSTTAGIGTHQIIYTYTNQGCIHSAAATITVVNSGCTLPAGNTNQIGWTTYTSNGTNFGFSTATTNPMLINGNIDIGNGSVSNIVTINCPDVRISPGVRILVRKNAKLVVDGSWLYACNQCNGGMWTGIEVEPGGTLEILNNSIIEDAITAVKTQAASAGLFPNIKIKNTIFNKNDMGILVSSPAGINIQPATANIVQNCIFTCRTLPSTTISSAVFNSIKNNFVVQTLSTFPTALTLSQARSRYGIYVADQLGLAYKVGVAASASNPEVNIFDNLDFGIYSSNSSLSVKNNIFQNCFGRNNNGYVTGVGIYGVNPIKPYTVTVGNDYNSITYPLSERNIFRHNLRGIDITNYTKAYIVNNSFDNSFVDNAANFNGLNNTAGQYGVLLQPQAGNSATSDYRINKNSVNNCYCGIHVKRTVNYINNIYEIKENSISRSGANTMNTGIYLEDAANNTPSGAGTINLSANTIVSADYYAILAKNIRKGLSIADNNELSIQSSNPTGYVANTARASIGLQSCQDASVERNTLIKTIGFTTTTIAANANLNQYGIYVLTSPGTKVRCNTVQQTSKGIAFEGNCGGSSTRLTDFTFNNIYTTNYGYVLQYLGVIGNQGSPNCGASNFFGNYGPLTITLGQTCVIGTGTNPATSSVYYANNTACGTTLTKVEKPCTNVALSAGTAYAYGATTGIILTVTTCVPPPNNCGTSGGGSGKVSGTTLRISNEEVMEIKLYPNPNSGSFILEHTQTREAAGGIEEPKVEFVVYDISGKRVYGKTLTDTNTQENIQLDELQNGIYYYQVVSNNQILKTDKLVIIK